VRESGVGPGTVSRRGCSDVERHDLVHRAVVGVGSTGCRACLDAFIAARSEWRLDMLDRDAASGAGVLVVTLTRRKRLRKLRDGRPSSDTTDEPGDDGDDLATIGRGEETRTWSVGPVVAVGGGGPAGGRRQETTAGGTAAARRRNGRDVARRFTRLQPVATMCSPPDSPRVTRTETTRAGAQLDTAHPDRLSGPISAIRVAATEGPVPYRARDEDSAFISRRIPPARLLAGAQDAAGVGPRAWSCVVPVSRRSGG